MSLTTIPAPVVPWTTVVATSDPTREPTRAKKRTLKEKGLLSEGLHVQSRQGGRAVNVDLPQRIVRVGDSSQAGG